MIQEDFDLAGRYFVQFDADGMLDQGWVRRSLGSGFYVVEVYIQVTDGFETALRIMHYVELRDATFYKDQAAAERHLDALIIPIARSD